MSLVAAQVKTSGRDIVVVDDDSGVREMLVRVLNGEGYSARPARDGEEALALASAAPPDLMLLDLGLPGRTGWETFAALRRSRPGLPVIVITAEPNQEVAAHSAGVRAFFEKPVDCAALLRAVGALLAPPAPVL